MASPCCSGCRKTPAWCSRPPCASGPGRAWSIRVWWSSDNGPDVRVALENPPDGAGTVDVEDHDGQLVGLAESEGVGVHDGVVLDDRFLIGELADERRAGVLPRILGVDPVHVGRLEDHLSLDLECPEHAGGVGGEERV